MSSLVRYVPPAREISNITNSSPAVVTTTIPHGYFDDIFITIAIPYPNMMEQIAGQTYLAKVLSDTTFSLYDIETLTPVNTTNLTTFNTGPTIRTETHAPTPPVRVPPGPPPPPFTPVVTFVPAQIPQAVPSGEFSTTLLNVSNVIGPRNPLG